jgi:hypothetical protein
MPRDFRNDVAEHFQALPFGDRRRLCADEFDTGFIRPMRMMICDEPHRQVPLTRLYSEKFGRAIRCGKSRNLPIYYNDLTATRTVIVEALGDATRSARAACRR